MIEDVLQGATGASESATTDSRKDKIKCFREPTGDL